MASRNGMPFEFLSKTGIYDVKIDGGITIKTRVADNEDVVDIGIEELKTELATMKAKPPVVGLDVKNSDTRSCLLILLAGSRCLVVQLKNLDASPSLLPGFFYSQTICFVGADIMQKINLSIGYYGGPLECTRAIDVGDLAARVLKKPNLLKSSLLNIAREIGELDLSALSLGASSPDWIASYFSLEEVKVAIEEANLAYKVGKKLFSMI